MITNWEYISETFLSDQNKREFLSKKPFYTAVFFVILRVFYPPVLLSVLIVIAAIVVGWPFLLQSFSWSRTPWLFLYYPVSGVVLLILYVASLREGE